MQEGYLSSTGRCFDIGQTVCATLQRYWDTGESFAGSPDPHSAGNGSLMRLAPVPLFFASDAETVVRMSGESSRTTHGAQTCIDACRYVGGLIVGAVRGMDKEDLLAPRYSPVPALWDRNPLCAEIDEIARDPQAQGAAGNCRQRLCREVSGSGIVGVPQVGDVRGQKGVYLLHNGSSVAYVGRTTDSLYARLHAHNRI